MAAAVPWFSHSHRTEPRRHLTLAVLFGLLIASTAMRVSPAAACFGGPATFVGFGPAANLVSYGTPFWTDVARCVFLVEAGIVLAVAAWFDTRARKRLVGALVLFFWLASGFLALAPGA